MTPYSSDTSKAFDVAIKKSAAKYIRSQDKKLQQRISDKIALIRSDPFDAQHSKWLAGHGDMRSARVGDIRLLFEVDIKERLVTFLYADSRGQVYDRFQ